MENIQTALRLIYPARCVSCGDLVEDDFGLCGHCWGRTPFIGGLVCNGCGVPLPDDAPQEEAVHCDECMRIARPWHQGRAALVYKDNARKLILALKHGDRQDIVRPAARWLAAVAKPLIRPNMLIIPVPLHWRRLMKRRYNQAALLTEALAHELGAAYCPDILVRHADDGSTEGLGFEARFARMQDAIGTHSKRRHQIAGRPVLIVDDVMTSGATLAACTEACQQSRASEINVLTLARVTKEDYSVCSLNPGF